MSAQEVADHSRCKMAHLMQRDVIEAGMKQAARLGVRFVCRDCGKPFTAAALRARNEGEG